MTEPLKPDTERRLTWNERQAGRIARRARREQKRLEHTQRVKRCVEMRTSGATFEAIGQALGMRRQSAHEMFRKALAAMGPSAETMDQARQLELWRLDVALAAIWGRVQDGEDFAVDRLVKLSKRRSELMGLDEPDRLAITTGKITLTVVGPVTRLVEDGEPPKELPAGPEEES